MEIHHLPGSLLLLDNVTLFCIWSVSVMMNVVRVEKWGDSFRVVKFFGSGLQEKKQAQRQRDADSIDLEPGQLSERFSQSLSRSRTRVKELALCNPWEYFATFTLADEKQDRFDIRQYVKDLGVWIGNYKKKYGVSDFAYLIIPEQHKSGAWHAHGLLHGLSDYSLVTNEYGYLDLPYYKNRFGFISLSPIKDSQRVASYVSKYITKDSCSTSQALGKGYHTFYSSRGLAGRVCLAEGLVEDLETDWENEWVGIKWVNEDEGNDIIRRMYE